MFYVYTIGMSISNHLLSENAVHWTWKEGESFRDKNEGEIIVLGKFESVDLGKFKTVILESSREVWGLAYNSGADQPQYGETELF